MENYDSEWPPNAPQVSEGATIINGVALPQMVIDQLRQLGISLSWYSESELRAAVEESAIDCQLIEDDDEPDFMDKLKRRKRTQNMLIEEDDDDPDLDVYSRVMERTSSNSWLYASPEIMLNNPFYDPNFLKKLQEERRREREKKRSENGKTSDTQAPA